MRRAHLNGNHPRWHRSLFCLTLLTVALTQAPALADDWPQWLGPQRDGVWREKGIVEKFPAGGPKELWRVPVGGGYAGPAVAEGRVYVTDRVLPPGGKNPANPFDKFSKVKGKERVLIIRQRSAKMPADLGGDIYVPFSDEADFPAVKERVARFIASRL